MSLQKPSLRDRSRADPPPSLANAAVGDEIRVQRIVMDLVQSMCRERGISVGDRLLVEARSEGDVHVRDEDGRSARLPDPYSFFVQVALDGEQPG